MKEIYKRQFLFGSLLSVVWQIDTITDYFLEVTRNSKFYLNLYEGTYYLITKERRTKPTLLQ